MTSVCIISDTHRQHRELVIPECDLLIHCGDMCSFQNEDRETLEDVDDWFSTLPAKHIVCIGGNHDFLLHKRAFRFGHAEYLCDRSVVIEGLTIYGSPWCPDLSGFAFYLPKKDLAEKWRDIPADTDILVTHTPPHGILDRPSSRMVNFGCLHLRSELERIRPRVHAFGHVHASRGKFFRNGIQFYNAAAVAGPEFKLRHQAFIHQFGN